MWLEIASIALCLILVLGSLGAAAWALLTGKAMEQGVDGLFLVIICLLFAALFAIIPLQSIRSGALQHLLMSKPAKADDKEEPQSEPAAAGKSQGKS